MAKRVADRPECLKNSKVKQILSVSNCISDDFADYVELWRHNGFWFFDSPEIIVQTANESKIDLAGVRWFYYEAHPQEFDEDAGSWNAFSPEPNFSTEIFLPSTKTLKGFDIVTNTLGQMVECSPLSCNFLAEKIEVNSDCLIDSFDSAHRFLSDSGGSGCEPGPYRIVAVYEVEPPTAAGEI